MVKKAKMKFGQSDMGKKTEIEENHVILNYSNLIMIYVLYSTLQ